MRFEIHNGPSFQTVRILRCSKSYQEVLERIILGIVRGNLGRRGGKCWDRGGDSEGRRKDIKSWLLAFLGLVQFSLTCDLGQV